MGSMFKNFFKKMTNDLGVDLGTANIVIYVKDKGIVTNEPSVVAINIKTDQVLAIGHDARNMLGKTPSYIETCRPLTRGIISDFEVTEKMLHYYFEKLQKDSGLLVSRPKVIIGVPLEITEVERKAVEDAVMYAGARKVYLVEEPMAAAIGAKLPIEDAVGSMVVDIGGGTTQIAVISLCGVVTWKSLPIAGDEMNKYIVQYARDMFNLILGEGVAENIKINIGSACPLEEPLETEMRGRDLMTGLPKEIIVKDGQIREALGRGVRVILENIKAVLEITPPELVADIYERGIVLTGGGAMLKGLDKAVAEATKIPARVATDPLTCVVRGAGYLLEREDLLKTVSLPSAKEGTDIK
jgi:rod shape-determining protein MreB